MKLPQPQVRYTPAAEAARNRDLEQADAKNMKRGIKNYVDTGTEIVLQASDGSWHKLIVSPTGTLSTSPVNPTS